MLNQRHRVMSKAEHDALFAAPPKGVVELAEEILRPLDDQIMRTAVDGVPQLARVLDVLTALVLASSRAILAAGGDGDAREFFIETLTGFLK
jgi:hypothetical protein